MSTEYLEGVSTEYLEGVSTEYLEGIRTEYLEGVSIMEYLEGVKYLERVSTEYLEIGEHGIPSMGEPWASTEYLGCRCTREQSH